MTTIYVMSNISVGGVFSNIFFLVSSSVTNLVIDEQMNSSEIFEPNYRKRYTLFVSSVEVCSREIIINITDKSFEMFNLIVT